MKAKKYFAMMLCGAMVAFAACEKNPPVEENPDGDGTQTEQPDTMGTEKPTLPDFNGHEYVDLGLPSGLLWATCNVGATAPEEYGDYFAWGETTTKETYNWSTYKYANGDVAENGYFIGEIFKYNTNSEFGTPDNKMVLDLEDDAAHVKWGGDWRMPTLDEMRELFNRDNCTIKGTTQNGVYGRKFTSKSNGNSIFFPAAGWWEDSLFNSEGANGVRGLYWSASLKETSLVISADAVWYLGLGPNYCGIYADSRCEGLSVRAVCSPKK